MPIIILLGWIIFFAIYEAIIQGISYLTRQKQNISSRSAKYRSPFLVAFLATMAIYAMILAYEANSTEETTVILATIFLFPLGVLLGFHTVQSLNKHQSPPFRKISCVVVMFVVPAAMYFGTWLSQNPLYFSGLRYTFEYGDSPSWHAVHIHMIHNGEYVFGPWIGAYPLRITFPDIDHDGYRDIRVIGGARVVEYQFLPERGENGQYWTLIKNTGYKVSYPPDGYYFP